MLILSEENHKLKGTKHTLPKKIVDLYHNIILKYPQFSANGGYRKADHVLSNNGVVTMEWLKGMKSFFNKHVDTNDIDFVLGGGVVVKTFVNNKLDQLTKSTPKTRKTHTNNPLKPLTPADNLSGHRGQKSSQALSMVNSLMTNVMPNLTCSKNNEIKGNTIFIREEQLKELIEELILDQSSVIENIKSQVVVGLLNSDDAAILIDESGIEVTNELYNILRDCEKQYINNSTPIQVGDKVLVKGKNGNSDFKGNFRGEDKNGMYCVYSDSGFQAMYNKDEVSKIFEKTK